VNRLEQTDGRGPSGKLLSPGTQILRFDIQDSRTAVVDNSQVPKTLRPLPPMPDAAMIAAAPQRYWEFSRTNGGWAVNNQFFDVTQPMAIPNAGAWEVWTIRSTGNWHHPVHIHFEEGRILSRNGVPPPPHEAGRKDVYVIAPGEEIRILLRFRDFNGKYMMHCHNLMHEDHAMMVRFDVIGNPITGPTIEPV
jgi:FtsP/CotA-like multicopper oxidase with cupredoxin domain